MMRFERLWTTFVCFRRRRFWRSTKPDGDGFMLDGVTLRPAEDTDRADILMFEELGMRRYAEELWGGWKASATIETLDLQGHKMILRDDQTVGCIQTLQSFDHLKISKLYIHPAARRRGIGAAVLKAKVLHASKLGPPIQLNVLKTNPDARRFYEREGLKLIQSTDERWLLRHDYR